MKKANLELGVKPSNALKKRGRPCKVKEPESIKVKVSSQPIQSEPVLSARAQRCLKRNQDKVFPPIKKTKKDENGKVEAAIFATAEEAQANPLGVDPEMEIHDPEGVVFTISGPVLIAENLDLNGNLDTLELAFFMLKDVLDVNHNTIEQCTTTTTECGGSTEIGQTASEAEWNPFLILTAEDVGQQQQEPELLEAESTSESESESSVLVNNVSLTTNSTTDDPPEESSTSTPEIWPLLGVEHQDIDKFLEEMAVFSYPLLDELQEFFETFDQGPLLITDPADNVENIDPNNSTTTANATSATTEAGTKTFTDLLPYHYPQH